MRVPGPLRSGFESSEFFGYLGTSSFDIVLESRFMRNAGWSELRELRELIE